MLTELGRVSELAVAAFETQRPRALVLPILHDTLLDGPATSSILVDDSVRSVVFGVSSLFVQVDVHDMRESAKLTVHIVPLALYRVGVQASHPGSRLAVTGFSPLLVYCSLHGPTSLLVAQAGTDVGKTWQTAWLVF